MPCGPFRHRAWNVKLASNWDVQPVGNQPAGAQIHQVGSPDPPSWHPKPSMMAPKALQNQAMRASWRALGAMLAPRWPQEPNKTTKRSPPDPQWTPKLEAKMEPKSIKNASKFD